MGTDGGCVWVGTEPIDAELLSILCGWTDAEAFLWPFMPPPPPPPMPMPPPPMPTPPEGAREASPACIAKSAPVESDEGDGARFV